MCHLRSLFFVIYWSTDLFFWGSIFMVQYILFVLYCVFICNAILLCMIWWLIMFYLFFCLFCFFSVQIKVNKDVVPSFHWFIKKVMVVVVISLVIVACIMASVAMMMSTRLGFRATAFYTFDWEPWKDVVLTKWWKVHWKSDMELELDKKSVWLSLLSCRERDQWETYRISEVKAWNVLSNWQVKMQCDSEGSI